MGASACPSGSIFQKPDVQTSHFRSMLLVTMARSSSGGVAICYVLPVSWIVDIVFFTRPIIPIHGRAVYCETNSAC